MRMWHAFTLIVLGLVLGGCGSGEAPLSNDRLIESFQQGRTGIWVSAQAPVTQIVGDEEVAGTTVQRFVIRPNDEIAVQVRHSLGDSERVPVERGKEVRVQGYYEWDARGGFISRTHADPEQPGGGGWIEYEGKRYD
jgi:uncharacterized lipoprotein YmbA